MLRRARSGIVTHARDPGSVNRVWVVTALLASGAAHADVPPEDAKRALELFEQGRKATVAKDMEAACEAFAQSLALDPQLGTRLNLGVCRVQQDRLLEAYALFEASLAEAERSGKTQRAMYAREQLRAVEDKLVRVHIVMTSPEGVTVQLAGATIDPAKRQLVRPGTLAFDATAAGKRPFHVEKMANAGAEVTVEIPALAPIEEPPPAPSVDASSLPAVPNLSAPLDDVPAPSRGLGPYLVLGAGGAMLLTAGVLTWHAHARWSTAIDERDSDGVTSAQREADAATVLSIGGAIAIGAGAYWWWRRGHSDHVIVTPTSNGIAIAGAM